MPRPSSLARRLHDRIEPLHAVTYFAPEARSALDALGYRGFWMGYFAARSAPLGTVTADVVTAAFYNFAPTRVAKALPAAWEVAPPAAALKAREESAVAALTRCGVTEDEATVVAELLAKATENLEVGGRVLFAANQSLPWPKEPVARLWHAATLLREHRGDGHVAVLTAHGVSGRECNVLHAAAGKVPTTLDPIANAFVTFDWYRAPTGRAPINVSGGPSAAGFYLDQDSNLGNHVFD